MLIQAYPPALALYPEGEWLQVEERLRDLIKHQPDARMWVLSMMANAVEVVPDSQGRILIPARFKEAAELDGQVMLVGAIDKIEIWNPTHFQQALTADAKNVRAVRTADFPIADRDRRSRIEDRDRGSGIEESDDRIPRPGDAPGGAGVSEARAWWFVFRWYAGRWWAYRSDSFSQSMKRG